MELLNDVILNLGKNFKIKEKRPNIFQLFAPFYHEDGDMLDIFLEVLPDGQIKVSDYGQTLMRLSYVYDIDTPSKEKILNKIVNANHVDYTKGTLNLSTDKEHFYPALMQFVQTISKVSNMKLYQREIVQNLFFDDLKEFIQKDLSTYNAISPYYPIPDSTEYEVDFCFNGSQRKKPIFLFGINNASNAKLATIACLKFDKENIKYKSAIVLEAINSVPQKDLSRLMSVAEKFFPTLEDFKENSHKYLEPANN